MNDVNNLLVVKAAYKLKLDVRKSFGNCLRKVTHEFNIYIKKMHVLQLFFVR